ncbi:MAG: hypothetical protein AAF718_06320 [Pseudomonadota bacterium]
MSEDSAVLETAQRLVELCDKAEMASADKVLAERCIRRLAHPLRLTVFGTDTRHAISLVNLMIGQPVISPSIKRARIQFLHGLDAHARVQYRDGRQERIEGSEFRRLFDENPTRVRIQVDLPVLKKLSIMVSAEADAKTLCEDVDKTLPPADIALWAGAELSEPLIEAWENVPDRLRDHSYLILSPDMDFANWKPIAQEFVEVIRVDPRRAQEAKEQEGGVDKLAFKEAGGAHIIKTIKKEIDILVQSAIDASEILFSRYGVGHDAADTSEENHADGQSALSVEAEAGNDGPAAPREQVYSVPLGKLASRSRMISSPSAKNSAAKTQRSVSLAIKNMPKTQARPFSKVATKARQRSRRSGPTATPWSLGL